MATKRHPVHTRVDSRGVRKRLGREVKDATTPLMMPLTRRDIEAARTKRHGYDVDEPENFGECVLATCVSKVAGAEVLIMRKHAFLALPDDEFTLRYEVAGDSVEFIQLNDEGRFDDIPVNVMIHLRPPSPSQRLAATRARKKNRRARQPGEPPTTRKPQRPTDPYHGVWRNGVHAGGESK